MDKYKLPLWVPLGILYVIGIAGFWAPNYIPAIAELLKNGLNEQWLGFLGALIAAFSAIGAAVIAWFAVQRQIRSQERNIERAETLRLAERDQKQIAAKFTATVALTQPVHSAATVLYGVRMAIAAKSPDEVLLWDSATKQACGQLEQTLNHYSLREIGPEMNIDDRVPFLILVVQLSSIVNIFNRPTGILPRDQTLVLMKNQLEGLRQYLTTYDLDLANAFERDSTVPIEVS
jgi:hypothetical protein